MDFQQAERVINLAGSAAGLLMLVVGIVGWLWSRANRPGPVQSTPKAVANLDSSRVLLDFDPDNSDVAGTFEHTIEQFKRRVHPEIQGMLLLDPKGLEANMRWRQKAGFYFAVAAAAFGVLLLALLPLPKLFTGSVLTGDWQDIGQAIGYPLVVLWVWGVAVRMWHEVKQDKEVAEVAGELSRYFEEHGIRMAYEFTQDNSRIADKLKLHAA